MTTVTWIEYGEPVSKNRVEATKRIEHSGGPHEPSRTEKIKGTLHIDALDVWEYSNHVHEDGSLFLSAESPENMEIIDDCFEQELIEVKGNH